MTTTTEAFFKKTWVLENQSAVSHKSTGSMVGDGRLELVFIKGNGYQAKFVDKILHCGEGIYLAGHLDQSLELEVLPETRITFVKLEPWTAGLLSGFNFQHSLNQTIPLAEINASLNLKLENLGAYEYTRHIMPLLLQEVAQKLPRNRDFAVIRYASQFMEANCLEFKQAKKGILEKIDMSSRSLETKFGRSIGLTPQKFANTIRFRKISESIFHRKAEQSLTALAHQFGYYDQAHFIRTCQDLLGIPPSMLTPDSCFITDSSEDFRYYTIP